MQLSLRRPCPCSSPHQGANQFSRSPVSLCIFNKIANSKHNLPVGNLPPISNNSEPAVVGGLIDNFSSLTTSSVERQLDQLLIGLGHSHCQIPRTSIHPGTPAHRRIATSDHETSELQCGRKVVPAIPGRIRVLYGAATRPGGARYEASRCSRAASVHSRFSRRAASALATIEYSGS